MTMIKRMTSLVGVLTLLLVATAFTQISYDNWNFTIKATNSLMTDSLATPGVRTDATSGFDSQYDIPRPPRAPSGDYLEVYFPHSGGSFPPILGTKYAVDFQGPADPAWLLSVEASTTGPIVLSWDSSYVNSIDPRIALFLYDSVGQTMTDMRTSGRYTFAYSVKRDFRIVGGVKVALKYLMEGFWNGTTQVRDTVKAFLAQSSAPYAFADSSSSFLSDSGTGLLVFNRAASGNYYLVIRHRNHLELWSALPLALTNGTTSISAYDFSASAGAAYGTNPMKQVGAVFTAWGGDVNQDGVVDFLDRNLTWNSRTLAGYHATDCNGDNITDGADATIVLNNRLKVRQHP